MILKPTDAFTRGRDYLHLVQGLALEPAMVDVFDNLRDRISICTWIGDNINTVNAQINAYLQDCHDCFPPQERRHIQIFAAPIAQCFGIDGLCNIFTNPITILIDVGRVAPRDWLGIVVHEYAHAHLANFGHNQQFASILSHLCLGLGLEPPDYKAGMEATLRSWPHCKSIIDPLEFWIGQ